MRKREEVLTSSPVRHECQLACVACGGCNIFDVFCLPATAETACWLLTAHGGHSCPRMLQSLRCSFLASKWSCNCVFSPPVRAHQEKFVDVFSHFSCESQLCLNCARDKMAQIKLQSNFCSKKLLLNLVKAQKKMLR